MRKLFKLVIIISSMLLINVQIYAQNVGIGANTFTPDNSALLEIRGTKGLLIPRMTTAQRDSMTLSSTPAQSLLIFNTTTKCYEGYVDGQWNQLWCSCIGFSVTASASPSTICSGSSSTITASGASTYNWSHSLGSGSSKTVTPTSTTTYTVTGTSSGCTGTATVSVTVNPLPNVTASASPSTINSGQSSVLSASGASTYSWSHSLGSGSSKTVTPCATTTYTVTGTSTAGCTGTATVSVTSTVTYDGVTYNTVQIGDQCWLKENLRTTKYNDGTSITNVTDNATWTSTTSGAYCCYSNDTSNCTTYGALYNWYAVNTGKLCPSGWHVPSDAEWDTLVNYLGGVNVAGGKLKETGTTHWWSPNNGATNSSGLTALPGGLRSGYEGKFLNLGGSGYWWSRSEEGGSTAWVRTLSYNNANVNRYSINERDGFSVRCLRD